MKNTDLINALYQNNDMGISSIKKLYPKIQNQTLRKEMKGQLLNYKQQKNKCVDLMRKNNIALRNISPFVKIMTSVGISLNCAKDTSSEHIAEMLVQGTNMGIIKINQAMNRASFSNNRFLNEAQLMLENEQRYIDNLKKYL